jgi:hypothetical protein
VIKCAGPLSRNLYNSLAFHVLFQQFLERQRFGLFTAVIESHRKRNHVVPAKRGSMGG